MVALEQLDLESKHNRANIKHQYDVTSLDSKTDLPQTSMDLKYDFRVVRNFKPKLGKVYRNNTSRNLEFTLCCQAK